jgi:ATP/maltotriose-dependent transcriptional regulator MalT
VSLVSALDAGGLGTGGPPLVGRRRELEVLDGLRERAEAGRAGVVMVVGPAGVGKSTLLATWASGLRGWHVAMVTADDAETAVPFGVVDQVMRELGQGHWAPAGVADHLDAAAVGACVIRALEVRAGSNGAVVLVDDAHWADVSSLHALGFAFRRLRRDPVMLVMAARQEGRSTEVADRMVSTLDGARLTIGGLDLDETTELVSALGTRVTDRASVDRLRIHTDGNPLHLKALLSEHGANALARLDPHPLPAPAAYAHLVVERLMKCSPDGRAVVEAASVLGQRTTLDALAVVAGVGNVRALVDEAVQAELFGATSSQPRTTRFAHPMVRAAVYHHISLEQRAALHERAASIAPDPVTALRHRLARADGPDPALADEFVKAAEDEAARNRWTTAAELLLDAAELTNDASLGFTHRLDAVDCMLLGGAIPEAMARWEEMVEPSTPCRHWHYIAGRIAACNGDFDASKTHLAWALRGRRRDTDALGARVCAQIATLRLNEGRFTAGARWARRAIRLAPARRPLVATGPLASLVFGLAGVGRGSEAIQVIADTRPSQRLTHDDLIGRGVAELWSGRTARARVDLSAVSSSRTASAYERILSLLYLTDADYRLGFWDDAVMHGELAVSLARDSDHFWLLPLVHSAASFPLAGRGEWGDAMAHIARAVKSVRTATPATEVWTATAAARVAHARGDAYGVVTAVSSLDRVRNRDGVCGLEVQPWQPMAVEALVALGRLDDARGELADLEAACVAHASAPGGVVMAHTRALVDVADGRIGDAHDAIADALDHDDEVGPFERSLAELALGALRRRLRQRSRARDVLVAALSGFDALGAVPYAERCERELAACGLTPQPRKHRDRERLTPQELSVANLAMRGLSNREIAGELVVSIKTVEFHLGNVYRKLAVSSRTQLLAVWPSPT